MVGLWTRVCERLKGRKLFELIIDNKCPKKECRHKVIFVFKHTKDGSESRYTEYLYGFEILQEYFHYTTLAQREHFRDYWYTPDPQPYTRQALAPASYTSLGDPE